VGAVIALSHAAKMPAVFEGIQTQAEADIALGAGADIVQGLSFLAAAVCKRRRATRYSILRG
jgi:EAL domain-containing protein (putative c-di-GMP-specific phosphodiesterase class I)